MTDTEHTTSSSNEEENVMRNPIRDSRGALQAPHRVRSGDIEATAYLHFN